MGPRLVLSLALSATTLAAPLLLSAPAQAQNFIDLNLGYTRFDDADTDAVTGRISANLLPHIAGEGEVSVGGNGSLDTEWGLFAKGALPISRLGEVFVRAGYADAEGAGNGDGGVAFGGGGQFMFDSRSGVRVEYTRYDFGDDVDTFGISYVLRLQ